MSRYEVHELTGYLFNSNLQTAGNAATQTDVCVMDTDYCYTVVFAANAPRYGPQQLERRRLECLWECGRLNREHEEAMRA